MNTNDDNLFYNPGWNDHSGYYAWRIKNQSRSTLNELQFQDRHVPGQTLLADARPTETTWAEGPAAEQVPGEVRSAEPRLAESPSTKTMLTEDRKSDVNPLQLTDEEDRVGVAEAPRHIEATGAEDTKNSNYLTLNSILFEYNEYRLDQTALKEVERICKVMNDLPECSIELTGHTDSKGSWEYNLVLSYNRAQSVAHYLVELGIDRNRITITASGEANPVAINFYADGSVAPKGRQLNRHTSFRFHDLPDDRLRVAEILVPEKLRPVQDLTYTVILTEIEERIKKMPTTIFGSEISIL